MENKEKITNPYIPYREGKVIYKGWEFFNWNSATSKYTKKVNIETGEVLIDQLPAHYRNSWINEELYNKIIREIYG